MSTRYCSPTVTSNPPGRGGRRTAPYAFTEQGVAMLSSVLGSPRAIAVNIEIMRTFVRVRALAAIPPRSNRLVQRHYDRHLYRLRNLIERFFNRLKHFRRVATRYDKLARSYLVFAQLACALKSAFA